jgi:magnesium transporter
MITIYKNNESGLIQIPEPTTGCWINVIDPTAEEISHLQALSIPHDYITYPLDLDERARTERENGEILVVLRIPYFQGRTADIPYITIPLGIILTPQYLVTICRFDNEVLQAFTNGHIKKLSTAKQQRFVLRMLLTTANKFLNYLRETNKIIDILEDQLQQSTRNKELLEILKYQKSLTYFTTALKSNELMVERLQRTRLFNQYPEDEDLLEDVFTENQQAIEMTSITINILNGMMDAFASIISNNLNSVMKFLASFTIMLSFPTMVASFYGMNVKLPFESLPYAFMLTLAFSLIISLFVGFVFWRRDWF